MVGVAGAVAGWYRGVPPEHLDASEGALYLIVTLLVETVALL